MRVAQGASTVIRRQRRRSRALRGCTNTRAAASNNQGFVMKLFGIATCMLASLVMLNPARADVRTLPASFKLVPPTDRTYTSFGQSVAIDGSAIIVVAAYDGGQAALLYRQTSGRWNFSRVLTSVVGPSVRTSARMKNGIAAVQFGDAISIFEYSGGDYVAGQSAAPIRHPGGLAISGNSI